MNHDILKDYIKKVLLGIDNIGVFETEYTLPYFDNEYYDVYIEYEIENINLWDSNDEGCMYEGTIYLKIKKILVGNKLEDKWERMYHRDDIPEWIWETIIDWDILEKLDDTNFCFDVTLNF